MPHIAGPRIGSAGDAPLHAIPDDQLLRQLSALLNRTRRSEADLVAHIGEVDLRKLYAREASPSMFAYCRQILHLSEHEAYLRIAVARAARKHPMVLAMLSDGRLSLAAIAKLARHLTPANRESLLGRAVHRSKRQLEELIAEVVPRPDVPDRIRKLPPPRSVPRVALVAGGGVPDARELGPDGVPDPSPTSLRPPAVKPLTPTRYLVQFTASAGFREKLERLQALMRTSVPNGDLAAILEEAVTEKLLRLEARRFGHTKSPRKRVDQASTAAAASRYIPAPVRRVVAKRDAGRCGYVDRNGRRCTSEEGLQFHHVQPHALGGERSPGNVRLMCPTHNRYLAELDFGRKHIARAVAQRRAKGRVPSPQDSSK